MAVTRTLAARFSHGRWLAVLVLLLPAVAGAQTPPVRHEMKVALDPQAHSLQVEDRITLAGDADGPLRFALHAGLRAASTTPGVKVSYACETRPGDEEALDYYSVTLPAGTRDFTLKYGGLINRAPEQEGSETRSFETTSGVISADGVFLAGASHWYPELDTEALSFSLEVVAPPGWEAVSQGERTQHTSDGTATRSRWESPQPQQEIYLIAARFTEYSRTAGKVEAQVFLRNPDAALAQRYLDATARYLALYDGLIGAYPYKKFALVENFWQTGYGMPSFTLLGSQVIRLPFIVDSSYPHEILHNWWGNGVYVDYASGNWSEGLTSYLADHLMQEQRGDGAEHRRAALQKYADFVAAGKDFPLTEFRSRHSAVTEAVGYGKTMMLFHMLRRELGDAVFTRALRDFYRDNLFHRASFADVAKSFSLVAGRDLTAEFDQWVRRPGAPELRVSQVKALAGKGGYQLEAVLEQLQPGPAYSLSVPLAVTIAGQQQAYQVSVAMDVKRLQLSLPVTGRPLRLDVDPEFDLFRRLARDEMPPALSQAFGADKVLLLLPSAAPAPMRDQYRRLAAGWRGQPSFDLDIRWDNAVERLPSGRAVWLLGWENRFRGELGGALAALQAAVSEDGAHIGDQDFARASSSIVLTVRHPSDPTATLSWVAAQDEAAVPGLARKLPHYARYSYAVFSGPEPANIAKGVWPVVRSPLSAAVQQQDGSTIEVSRAKLAPRAALGARP